MAIWVVSGMVASLELRDAEKSLGEEPQASCELQASGQGRLFTLRSLDLSMKKTQNLDSW